MKVLGIQEYLLVPYPGKAVIKNKKLSCVKLLTQIYFQGTYPVYRG